MITSTKNEKIINLRKLDQRKHRRLQNRFYVEGLQLIGMALEGGHTPLEVFYCRGMFTGTMAPHLLEKLGEAGGRMLDVSASVMDAISDRDAPQGIVATFPLFETPFESILKTRSEPSLLVVIDRLQDPGNLGTLIRTADAVAADGVILIEPCVDLFEAKTVRGSMGSIFTLPIVSTFEPQQIFAVIRKLGYKITGADGYKGEYPWQSPNNVVSGSVAMVMGNEARGLSPDLRPQLTHWVRLPMMGKAESLNVAVAGGILMYQWVEHNGLPLEEEN